MTAASTEQPLTRYGSLVLVKDHQHGIKANVKCIKGTAVVANSGYAAPATEATGLITLGVCTETVDNTGGSNDAKKVPFECGVFPFANSASGDAITNADIGKDCYWVDNITVAKTDNSGARSRAGKVIKVENSKVFVLVGIGV